jgi:hypothetical protein
MEGGEKPRAVRLILRPSLDGAWWLGAAPTVVVWLDVADLTEPLWRTSRSRNFGRRS